MRKRKPTKGHVCFECKASLYIIDSRMDHKHGNANTASQWRQRRYCCPNCGNRYIGIEVLNPVPYTNKPLPKCILKQKGIIDD